ncbi:unnamed protein product [Hermetia illucens]|uniref:Uncharacterized protein n=1 Tax=Hermetia illucens TaxID=343691 RepID=A0A7R8UT88_HERIL|nr:unnamed protein product [Hermetia illucens]
MQVLHPNKMHRTLHTQGSSEDPDAKGYNLIINEADLEYDQTLIDYMGIDDSKAHPPADPQEPDIYADFSVTLNPDYPDVHF